MTWPMKRLRYLATFNPSVPASVRADAEGSYPLLPMDSINEFTETGAPEVRPVGDLLNGYSYLEPTDVAYAKVTPCFENGKGLIGSVLDGPTFATTEITVLRPHTSVNQRFLGYLLQSSAFRHEAIASMTGAGGLKRVSEVAMRDLRVPAPPLEEQKLIADYLDRETAEIDAFIKDQERFKKLLLEHREATRSSVIRRAAERQGAPHVRLKFLADVTVGIVVNPSSWYVEEEGVPALRGLNVRPEEISTSELVQISQEGHIAHSKSRLEAGDVVVVRTGQAGAAAVIPEHLHDCNAIDLLIVKPGDTLSSDFLSMYINSDVARGVISAQSVGAIQAHFNVEALRNLSIPYLDLPQQLRLVATWKEESSAVELALRDVETSIQLAQERRSALISAAVTGQIDVAAQNLSAADHLRDELEVYA